MAQISFTLNRIYTEFYRAKGFNFDITSSTAIDQNFVFGRNTFDTTDKIVDEIFNDYIRRVGNIEPLAAKYCNGTTVTCAGLSQWGSEDLANQGYSFFEILTYYYGKNIELVEDEDIANYDESYPGYPLNLNIQGKPVTVIQTELNRISVAYPNINKLTVDGFFGPLTQNAVKLFQKNFMLTADGIVGKATWYKLVETYTGLLKLSEINSEGVKYSAINLSYPDAITPASSGQKVKNLQYILSVISEYFPEIPPVTINGVYDQATENAVNAFQKATNLPVDGIVDETTWTKI